MRLSQTRAQSMVDYLANRGIARSRLQAVGYGETRPIADNSTEIGRRLNRRIDAIIACATDIEGLTPAAARVTMAMEMEFDTNRADIRPEHREELRRVANFMRANPRVNATVEGHTSNQSGTAAQRHPGQRRAAQERLLAGRQRRDDQWGRWRDHGGNHHFFCRDLVLNCRQPMLHDAERQGPGPECFGHDGQHRHQRSCPVRRTSQFGEEHETS
jgi:hypothetical protein